MYEVVLLRDLFFDQQASLGSCLVFDDLCNRIFKSCSLERGWVNNEHSISCIPTGIFDLVYEWSDKFQMDLWEIKGVPGRSECKFHVANFWTELNGCIGLGKYETNLDNDPIMDIAASAITMQRFHKALEGQRKARLKVIDVRNIII